MTCSTHRPNAVSSKDINKCSLRTRLAYLCIRHWCLLHLLTLAGGQKLSETVMEGQYQCLDHRRCLCHCGQFTSNRTWMLGSELWIKVLVSIAVCLKRRIAVFRRLQRISRGHMAIGKGEVPKASLSCIFQVLMITSVLRPCMSSSHKNMPEHA